MITTLWMSLLSQRTRPRHHIYSGCSGQWLGQTVTPSVWGSGLHHCQGAEREHSHRRGKCPENSQDQRPRTNWSDSGHLIERSMKEQLNRVNLRFRSRFEVCFRIVFGSALLGRTETRTELPSLPPPFFNPTTFFFVDTSSWSRFWGGCGIFL